MNDGHRPGGTLDGATLDAFAGIGARLLVSTLGHGQTFQSHRIAGRVHHDEHVLEAFIGLADQIAGGATIVAERHDRRRAGVYAELVFDRHAVGVIARPQGAIAIDEELRRHEQRYPLHPLGCVRQSRQHQMDDVLGHVVIAIGDEDLLAEYLVAAIGLWLGAATDGGQVRSGLRLRQIHRAGPGARHHLGQKERLLLGCAGQFQRLDRTMGQQGTQRKRVIGRFPHLRHGGRHQSGQALAAMVRRAVKRSPAALRILPVCLLEAGGHGHGLVRPTGALAVAYTVQRRQHTGGKLAGLVQDGLDHIQRRLFVAGQRRYFVEPRQFRQHEPHVLQGSNVITHGSSPLACCSKGIGDRRRCRPNAGNRPPSA